MLLDSLLQALVLALQLKHLLLKLGNVLHLSCELLTADLSHALHVRLLRDVPLMVLIERIYLFPQLAFLLFVSGTDGRQVTLPRLVGQVLSEHLARRVDVILDRLFFHLARLQVLHRRARHYVQTHRVSRRRGLEPAGAALDGRHFGQIESVTFFGSGTGSDRGDGGANALHDGHKRYALTVISAGCDRATASGDRPELFLDGVAQFVGLSVRAWALEHGSLVVNVRRKVRNARDLLYV